MNKNTKAAISDVEMIENYGNRDKTTIGDKYIEKYPGNIPVIVEYNGVNFIVEPKNKKSQLLVPADTTLAYLVIIIRRSAKIVYSDNIVLYINGIRTTDSNTLSMVYPKYKNINDGCLHITAVKE